MSKYIDADRLKAELNRLIAINKAMLFPGKVQLCENLLALIASLQQEQPHLADAGKMERLNVEDLHEWSMRFAPDIRDAIESTAYHFWNLAINAIK